MARVVRDDCLRVQPNKYLLTIEAALIAKEIHAQDNKYMERKQKYDKNTVEALRCIAAQAFDNEEIKEKIINSLRSNNNVDVVKDQSNLHSDTKEEVAETEIDFSPDEASDIYIDHNDVDPDFSHDIIDDDYIEEK